MAVRISPVGRQQFFSNQGAVAAGMKLFTYAAGTTNKLSTYTDSTGNTANANPIVLDSAGRTPSGLWLTDGTLYKFVLAPANDTDPPTSPIWTEDNVTSNDASLASLGASSGATLIGFLQDGADAVARTGAAKMGEQRTAEDYDAEGDGSSDDSTEFTRLIAAATAGEVVRGVKGRTYRIDSSVTVSKSLTFKNFKFKIGGNITMFSLAANDIGFVDCEFDLALGTTSASKAISATDRSRIRVKRCKFMDGQYGAYLDNCSYVWFEENYCDNAAQWHFFAYGGSYIHVRGNICLNSTFDGIKFASETTTSGVTRSLSNIEVTGNLCALNDRDGIDMATNDCQNVVIANNVLVNNKLCAIEVKTVKHADTSLSYSMRNVLISGNVCRNGSYTDNNQSMISCQSGDGDFGCTTLGNQLFQDVRITGNRIHLEAVSTNSYYGIRSAEVVSPLIDGNHITTAAGTGGSIGLIRVHYGTKTIIRNNEVNGAGVASAAGISASSFGTANATTGVVITKNRVYGGSSANPFNISDAAVSGTQIFDNEVYPDGTDGANQYSLANTGTNTRYTNNCRGVISGNPNVRGYPGDYFYEASVGECYPKRWAAISQASPAVWVAEDAPAAVVTTAVGNVGAGEDDLQTFSLPANSQRSNGSTVRITAWGTKANNANAKTVKLYYGTAAISTTSLGTSAAGNWRIRAEVLRTGANAQDHNSAMVGTDTDIESGTATQTETSAITIKCTGDATSNNDIVQEGLIVELVR